MSSHSIEPDGYCQTCRAVPCLERSSRPADIGQQLTRIELLLRKVGRKLDVEVEGD